jgi:chorismate synthase
MSNTFGERFRVTTWGESHGPAVGAVVDGCPAGLVLGHEDLVRDLARDVPDAEIGTPRREPNEPEILSGVFEGKTLGSPILILIRNRDVCSTEYLTRRDTPRPGHADLPWRQRYGHVDPRGGGRSSGRECVARLAAGAVARKLLARSGVTVSSRVIELAGIPVDGPEDMARAREEVKRVFREGDSTGGRVQVVAEGLPAGLGEPVFGKLSSRVGEALLTIGGVKGVEIGEGGRLSSLRGSEANDPIVPGEGSPRPATNRAGGVTGGISTGLPLVVTVAVKPTPTIRAEQDTVDVASGEPVKISGAGRFDMNFAPRVAVVGEAMVALVLVDALMEAGRLSSVRLGPEE